MYSSPAKIWDFGNLLIQRCNEIRGWDNILYGVWGFLGYWYLTLRQVTSVVRNDDANQSIYCFILLQVHFFWNLHYTTPFLNGSILCTWKTKLTNSNHRIMLRFVFTVSFTVVVLSNFVVIIYIYIFWNYFASCKWGMKGVTVFELECG